MAGHSAVFTVTLLTLYFAVVEGATCYRNSYSFYCSSGCCTYYSYSYYSGYSSYKTCCSSSGSSSALYIGLGVTAGILLIGGLIVLFLVMSQKQTKSTRTIQPAQPKQETSVSHPPPAPAPINPPPYQQTDPTQYPPPPAVYPPPPQNIYPPPSNPAYPPPAAYGQAGPY